ncbi:PAS domain S-box protein [Deferribacterales bacterium Es71-Z0220]|uniref:PAS domain S-box protein n=1 Tax=Deferrivibrio essentukiensis TaxID=2880922 RepID=UPI001F61AE26|nr:PAS domain S-box protein [Deferrivibrio essentukiensis]MCB4204267.1 PAS domain S-box protein [Deferrivibrio essentukiensis]
MKEQLSFILKNIHGVIFLIDLDGKFVLSEGLALKRLGLKAGEIVGLSVYDVYKDYPDIVKSVKIALQGETVKKKIKVNDLCFDVIFSPYIEDNVGQTGVIGLATDITDIESTKAAMADNKNNFKTIIDLAPECFLMGDPKGNIIYVNDKAEEITGYSAKDILNKNISILFTEESLKERPLRYDLLEKGESVISERQIRRADGSVATIQSNSKRMSDGTLVAFIRDVTDLKEMQKKIELVSKLDSLGYLAAGIAHNFNNLMTGIFNYIAIAKLNTQETATKETLEKVENLIDEVRKLTGKLLTFSKGGYSKKIPQNIEAVVSNICYDILDYVKYDVKNNMQTSTTCSFDRGQIELVVKNIIDNAMESMPNGGELVIDSERINLSENNKYDLISGSYIKISVTDSGCGIKEENMAKIFDPFYTTKESSEGIGLSLAHSILKKHDGAIHCFSSSESGTTFEIFLPVC